MCSSDVRERIERMRRELRSVCNQLSCTVSVLYKRDYLAGFVPVLSSCDQGDGAAPYLSSASDVSVSVRANGPRTFRVRVDTSRDRLVQEGFAEFGITELLVCPLNVQNAGDYILTLGSARHLGDGSEMIAKSCGDSLGQLLSEFVSSVGECTQTIDLRNSLSSSTNQKTESFQILQSALACESYDRLIEAASEHFPHAGAILVENHLGHVLASSKCEMRSLKGRFSPLVYHALLDIVQASRSPLIVSDAALISAAVDSDSCATQAQCLIIPLYGGNEFLGLLSIFGINGDDVASNVTLITSISFAATYVLRSSEASRNHTLQKVLSSIEDERRSVSIDLHDGTSQDLVALNVRLATAQRVLEEHRFQEASHIIEDCVCIADGILTEVNRLSSELRSSELTYLGFREAIEAVADRRLSKKGISYTLAGNALDWRSDDFREPMLLRGVTEALSNCARHSQAANVVISLDDDGTVFTIQVSDDGVGFDDVVAPFESASHHYGIKTMCGCANSLGGMFWIGSHPGRGTTVRFSIPSSSLEGVAYE